MTKTILILLSLILSSCASDATIAYEKARYEANPNYNDVSNQSGTPLSYTPKDRDNIDYFSCLNKYNQRFNSSDSRWICSP